MINNKLKKILSYHFISSTLYFIHMASIPLLIYTSYEEGGLDKFGFTDIQETAKIRANIRILASFISMSCGIFSSLIDCHYMLKISSILFFIALAAIKFCKTSIVMFAISKIFIETGNLMRQIALYRYIDLYSGIAQGKQEDKLINKRYIFSIYMILINLGASFGFGLTGIIRQNFGYPKLFNALLVISFINMLYYMFTIKQDNAIKQDNKKESSIFIKENGYPTKHMFSFYTFIIILFSTSLTTCNNIPKIYLVLFIIAGSIVIVKQSYLTIKNKILTINSSHISKILILMVACMVNKAIFVSLDLGEMPLVNWINKYINSSIFNIQIPAESISAITPILITVLNSPVNNIIAKMKKQGKISNTDDLIYGMLFILLTSMCFLGMHIEMVKTCTNTIFIPILYYVLLAIGESICGPASSNYQSSIVSNKYIGNVIITTQTIFAMTSTLFTVIPHKSLGEKNILPTFYLSFFIYLFVIIWLIIAKIISKKYTIKQENGDKTIQIK